MKWLLDGHPSKEELPREWREYLLCSHFKWTKQQYDEQPAAWCDWMLEFIGIDPHSGG